MSGYEIIIEIYKSGRLVLNNHEYGSVPEIVSNSKWWLDRWKREREEVVYADDE